jgi:hypothetical protein
MVTANVNSGNHSYIFVVEFCTCFGFLSNLGHWSILKQQQKQNKTKNMKLQNARNKSFLNF